MTNAYNILPPFIYDGFYVASLQFGLRLLSQGLQMGTFGWGAVKR